MNIVITGASSGIGFEAAIELAGDANNKVVALARTASKLQNLASITSTLHPESKLYPIEFDIVNGDYASLTTFLESEIGPIDLLINNAGILINKPFLDTSARELEEMLMGNVIGHWQIIQAVVPLMPTGAHILNIGSMGGFQGSVKFPGLAAYSASKAALHTLTECLAFELAEKGIKVNCLALGSAQTEMLEAAFPGYESPVMAVDMGKYIADFGRTGHQFFNGKVLPVAVTTP